MLTPWEDGDRKVAAVGAAYDALPADLGRRRRGADLRDAVRRLPPQAPPRHRAARRSSRPWPSRWPIPTNLTFCCPTLRPRLPDVQLPGDPRLRRGRARARGAPPLGDGAAQPVPVGPRRTGWPGRRARRRRLRRRVPPAQPRRARVHPPGAGRAPARPRPAAARVEARQPVGPTRRCGCASSSRSCRSSRRWPWSRASTSAPTRTSSATPPTTGRR